MDIEIKQQLGVLRRKERKLKYPEKAIITQRIKRIIRDLQSKIN